MCCQLLHRPTLLKIQIFAAIEHIIPGIQKEKSIYNQAGLATDLRMRCFHEPGDVLDKSSQFVDTDDLGTILDQAGTALNSIKAYVKPRLKNEPVELSERYTGSDDFGVAMRTVSPPTSMSIPARLLIDRDN